MKTLLATLLVLSLASVAAADAIVEDVPRQTSDSTNFGGTGSALVNEVQAP